MTDYMKKYERWLTSPKTDDDTKKELSAIKDNEKEIEDRFYRELEFGTAGMRGVIGAGTNRMNKYNVRRATMGVAKRVSDLGEEAKKAGVLIGYDTRNFSKEFATETACVLAANGINVYLFDKVHAVPEVSFGIRYLKTAFGVMITASHNPKEYNGYKVYAEDGGQLPPDSAEIVVNAINSYDVFDDIITMPFEEAMDKGLIKYVPSEVDEKFLDAIQKQQLHPECIAKVKDSFNVIYTPFHGTGSRPVKAILNRMGMDNVLFVKEQDTEDGNFPTVKSPNPEEKEGFTIAIEMAKKNDVDLIIGTDPDCDRIGIVVRDENGEYVALTGNQTGALLCEYVLSQKKNLGLLKNNSIVIKTIVSTELVTAIANNYNVKIENVLTGFKYIGEKITEFDKNNSYQYEFGFEESYGYLVGTHGRDKDGVVATMLVCEMATFYKTRNLSIYEQLQNIYKKYGYYCEKTVSVMMPGKDGMEKMAKLMEDLRNNPPKEILSYNVTKVTDYQLQTISENGAVVSKFNDLPKSNVLRFDLSLPNTYFLVRPSGTEPKVKIYMASCGKTQEESQQNVEKILNEFIESIK